MAGLLAGKSAAITGGVTGIGRAIALEFMKQGAAVTVNHMDDDASRQHFASLAKEAPKGARLQAVAGDIGQRVTGQKIVSAANDAFGALDVFVANAGVSQFREFLTYVLRSEHHPLSLHLTDIGNPDRTKPHSNLTFTSTFEGLSGVHKPPQITW